MEIKEGEGILFENSEGQWVAYYRPAYKEDAHRIGGFYPSESQEIFFIFQGDIKSDEDFTQKRVVVARQTFLHDWRKISQPSSGFKRVSKFFGVSGLTSMINAEKKNHVIKPDEDFMNELKDIE